MTAAVLENLALLADAPGGVERLRVLIRDLAVTGNLVSPGHNAANWKWSTLGEQVSGMDSGWSPACLDAPSSSPEVWGVLRTTAVQSLRYIADENKELPANLSPRPEAEVRTGDVLFTRAGPMNRVGISCLVESTRPRLMLSDKIIRFQPNPNTLDGRFTALCLNAGATAAYLETAKSGMAASQVNISQAKLKAAPIPCPPLAEQHRIVAKVDELMALCDRLEARQQDAEAAHARLVQALLDTLTQARDADEFQDSWRRVVQDFGSIFSTDSSIDGLRKMVLLLGVSGRLTTCDQSSADASERSAAKPLWDTAQGWVWRTLGEVLDSGIQNGISPKAASTETPVRCLTLSATTRGKFNASCFKHVDLDDEIAEKYRLQPGDLLVQRANSIDYVGVSAIYDGEAGAFIFPDLMMRMRASKLAAVEFLQLCLAAEPSRAYMRANATGTQGNMPKVNQGTVSGIPVPVPPLETQHRVVAKVTELLTLCDQLKARIASARAKHAQLAEALVAQAVAA